MNNETVPSPVVYLYEEITQRQAFFASSTILIYASLLHFPEEVKYIWKQKFTFPTFLYLSSKYPAFFHQALLIAISFLPETPQALRTCNYLSTLARVIALIGFIGIQGIISVRTYSICREYRSMKIALSIAFLIPIIFQFYLLTLPGCTPPPAGSHPSLILLAINISSTVSEMLAFIGVIYQVWGVYKLKRSLRIQGNGDISSTLLHQGILRFIFAIFISNAGTFLTMFKPGFVGAIFTTYENVLSSILICEFTLDLRRRCTEKSSSHSSEINAPHSHLSFQANPIESMYFVLGRLHDSIVNELGEEIHTDDSNSGNSNETPGSV